MYIWRYQRPVAGVTKVEVGGCCERADVEMRRHHFSSERVRSQVRSQVLRFSLLRAATDSPLLVPSTPSAGRQSLSKKVHICRLQNSNSAASSVTIRIQIKSKIFVGDRRFGALEFPMWNFNSRVCAHFPRKTRDGEPKPKKIRKKNEFRIVLRSATQDRESRESGSQGPRGYTSAPTEARGSSRPYAVGRDRPLKRERLLFLRFFFFLVCLFV